LTIYIKSQRIFLESYIMTEVLKNKETVSFQAEVKQILSLFANAMYSDKEIFLRELISNSSDALEKFRYEQKNNAYKKEDNAELTIKVVSDPIKKTLTFIDNGIGMNMEDVKQNLGTIAHSGTKKFTSFLKQKDAQDSQDAQGGKGFIGQFGIGFYSAFVVANNVTVYSKKAGLKKDEAVYWRSAGQGEYEVGHLSRDTRGTEVVLELKDSESAFLEGWKLEQIIKKFSDFLQFNITLTVIEEVKEIKEDKKEKDAEDQNKSEPVVDKLINKGEAIWLRNKTELKADNYEALYAHLSGFGKPLAWAHNRVEGKFEYTTLLYIPEQAPFDLYHREYKSGLKLYVQRIFIMEKAEQFLPSYLRFITGIVDCADLPLNVSRELLQNNEIVETIKNSNAKRVLNLLEDLSKDNKEKYQQFWDAFGQVLKEGPAEDFVNREKIGSLLRFASTQSEGDKQTVSLDEYIGRMKEEGEAIYYIVAENYVAAANSPQLEMFNKKNIEVLLLSDRVDEWLVTHMAEFKGKKLKSVSRGSIEEPETEEEKKAVEEAAKDFESILKQVKECLSEQISEVKVSKRLTDSPSCVVVSENEMTNHMQRLLKEAGQNVPDSKPLLEINVDHALVKQLKNIQAEEQFKQWSQFLLDQALLAEGGKVQNPAAFVQSMNEIIERKL
jgi:molecular chaperone HtpG